MKKTVKKVARKLTKKLAPERSDDLLEVDPSRLIKKWISVSDRKAPWLELAKEAYRFVKTGKA